MKARVKNMPSVMHIGKRPVVGHEFFVDSNKYFIAPTIESVRIFIVTLDGLSLFKTIKVTQETINKTGSIQGFVNYVYEDIVPLVRESGVLH